MSTTEKAETPQQEEGKNAQKLWKKAEIGVKTGIQIQNKVVLENKIGKKAVDLDDSNPLKTIALCCERSIRAFGSYSDKQEEDNYKILDKDGSIVEFNACTDARYDTRQPKFKCTSLQTNQFANVRDAFQITDTEYYSNLGLQDERNNSSYSVIGSEDASGKSPSFFFLSSNQEYIIKSCTKRDEKTLLNILDSYVSHVESTKPSFQSSVPTDGIAKNTSLMPRYIGLYKFEFPDIDDIPDCTLVVMTNFFAGVHEIHKKYDLKGSTSEARTANEKERKKKSPCYKDLDWIAEKRKLSLPSKKEMDQMLKSLKKDAEFLAKCNLVDYSLLVGVHELSSDEKDARDSMSRIDTKNVICTCSKNSISYFGIVDILTPYVFIKRMETIFRGPLSCRTNISCQPPKKYASRFIDFCSEQILNVDEDSIRLG